MNKEAISPPFTDPQNITIGLARVIWAPVMTDMLAYHLPGCRVTFDRHEAYAYAVRMNQIMGGVQTVREVV